MHDDGNDDEIKITTQNLTSRSPKHHATMVNMVCEEVEPPHIFEGFDNVEDYEEYKKKRDNEERIREERNRATRLFVKDHGKIANRKEWKVGQSSLMNFLNNAKEKRSEKMKKVEATNHQLTTTTQMVTEGTELVISQETESMIEKDEMSESDPDLEIEDEGEEDAIMTEKNDDKSEMQTDNVLTNGKDDVTNDVIRSKGKGVSEALNESNTTTQDEATILTNEPQWEEHNIYVCSNVSKEKNDISSLVKTIILKLVNQRDLRFLHKDGKHHISNAAEIPNTKEEIDEYCRNRALTKGDSEIGFLLRIQYNGRNFFAIKESLLPWLKEKKDRNV